MNDLVTDLGLYTPAFSGLDLTNVFSSNPDYDEACGPPRDGRYIPVDEFSQEEGVAHRGFDGCASENESDYWDRLMFQDPDEPLGPGETVASVREDVKGASPLIIVDPDYRPDLGPTPTAVRLFNGADMHATAGVVTVAIRKFDRATKRWVRVQSSVTVSVRAVKRH